MKNFNKGFIIPLLFIIIGLLVVGGGAYVYTHQGPSSKGPMPPLPEDNKNIAPAAPSSATQVTLVGAVYNSVRIQDATTFLFTDNNEKVWTVNYSNADFNEYSLTQGHANGTDGLLQTTLQDWLKIQKHVGDAPDQTGAPGSITITGTLNADGSVVASAIKVSGQ